jgi:hypothetical protein
MVLPVFAPSLFYRPRVHSRELRRVPIGSSVPPDESCSVLTVSHRLDGFLHAVAAGLLHPAASLGVRHVSTRAGPGPSEDVLAIARDSRDGVHTLRRVPLVSSRTTSLRPLPSYRFTPFSLLVSDACASEETTAGPELSRTAEALRATDLTEVKCGEEPLLLAMMLRSTRRQTPTSSCGTGGHRGALRLASGSLSPDEPARVMLESNHADPKAVIDCFIGTLAHSPK